MAFLLQCCFVNICNNHEHRRNDNSLSSNDRNSLFVPNGLFQHTIVFYETIMGMLSGPCCMTINTGSKLAFIQKAVSKY